MYIYTYIHIYGTSHDFTKMSTMFCSYRAKENFKKVYSADLLIVASV